MRTEEFDYPLPPELIAQAPIEPRDSSRLMHVERSSGRIAHHRFREIAQLLHPGDLLVANDSRVLPARVHGIKVGSGGRVEALLLRPGGDPYTWHCLLRGRVREGNQLRFGQPSATPVEAEVVERLAGGERVLRFSRPPSEWLGQLGEVPLPPYIRRGLDDPERYQTIYARVEGSAAAPTAGLHFTEDLRDALTARGVDWAFVTLHIGLDTFKPVEAENIEEHRIHREWVELPEACAEAVERTRRRGGRVVAVGTTSMRVLETAAAWAASSGEASRLLAGAGWTDLYLRPGSQIRAVDALITNFHLPRSSLLMLVAAFAGKELVDRAYQQAIGDAYRFFSFGDAMFIS